MTQKLQNWKQMFTLIAALFTIAKKVERIHMQMVE
jgi:hypothetical protein